MDGVDVDVDVSKSNIYKWWDNNRIIVQKIGIGIVIGFGVITAGYILKTHERRD